MSERKTRSKSKAEGKKEAKTKPKNKSPKKKQSDPEQINTVAVIPKKRTYSAMFDNVRSDIELMSSSTKRMRISSEETDKDLSLIHI